jgi:hypothetical protein
MTKGKKSKVSIAEEASKTIKQHVTASKLPKVKGIVRVRAVPGTNVLVQNKVYELHPDHAAKMINRGVAQLV